MNQITILSGLASKTPACILVDTGKTQVLLDLGEGPAQGVFPELPPLPRLAAILITHDHMDHVDGLKVFDLKVPVYVTRAAAHAVPDTYVRHIIPEQGRFQINDIPVTTGRSGHAMGAVWFHIGLGRGFFYSGDLSLESGLFPFDPPPPAALAALDNSYGCRDRNRDGVIDDLISRACTGQCLLPVPPSGRALEIALGFKAFGFDYWSMDEDCWQAFDRFRRINQNNETVLARLACLDRHPRHFDPDALILIANSPCGTYGRARQVMDRWLAQGLHNRQIIYTGHLTKGCRAQVESGTARWLLWNVHPRIQDIAALIKMTGCQNWIPLFSEQGFDTNYEDHLSLLPATGIRWDL